MAWTRAALALVAVGAVALVVVSGGSEADPRTPPALPGLPPPFLGTAVTGSGGLTAAVDAYGDVVDLRAPGPAGRALIDNPSDRQAAGTVSADTGIVPRVSIGGGAAQALWQADSVSQRYLPGTNVVRTEAHFRAVRVVVTSAAAGRALAMSVAVQGPPGVEAVPSLGVDLVDGSGLRCRQARRPRRLRLFCAAAVAGSGPDAVATLIERSATADRRWLSGARPLGPGAPRWATEMYARSLLTLRALTESRTGAVAAGARDGWAYVWPRDAGTAALAFASSGYGDEARRVARFLLGLDLDAAARFYGNGTPVPGRGSQGDAAGWVAVAARAAGVAEATASAAPGSRPRPSPTRLAWRDRPDYEEGAPSTYLANAIAATATPTVGPDESSAAAIARAFGSSSGLLRRAGEPGSGLDSAAAWAVRPFPLPSLFPTVGKSLLALAQAQSRFGITPGEQWPGVDPWSAPTAWTAWSLAALGDRRPALRLLDDLRRAATPAGTLPERVDATTGIPRSTTPLAWPHAFAILALRELWP